METFGADWLALREPTDHISRPASLLQPLNAWWEGRGPGRHDMRVLDLGSGSGSNLRYLAPKLRGRQHWTLVDHDSTLLRLAEAPSERVSVRRVAADLATEGSSLVDEVDLVTASALLDLVSKEWLSATIDRCVGAGCAVLFALSYDGTIEWRDRDVDPTRSPNVDPFDEQVRNAVNAHQRQDKGLGLALGPDAAPFAERCFAERGYRTWRLSSPWELGSSEVALAEQLVEGWAAVAQSMGGEPGPTDPTDRGWENRVSAWAEQRVDALRKGKLRLTVGHQDILALPRDPTDRTE